MKKSSHKYNINRLRPRHAHKYAKYKMFQRMMMLICIKQHLSNTSNSNHENKLRNTEANLKKALLMRE